jgi:hypothetical protein
MSELDGARGSECMMVSSEDFNSVRAMAASRSDERACQIKRKY